LGLYCASFLPHGDIAAEPPPIQVLFEDISIGYFLKKSGRLFGGLGFKVMDSRKFPSPCYNKSYTTGLVSVKKNN
jgi:hypothetical protein